MMVTMLRLGLFLISGLGYWEYFRSRHNINVYFAPVYTVSVQFCVLFAAGILNCLKDMTLALYALGLLLFLKALYQRKLRLFSEYLNGGYVYFAAALVMAALIVRGQQFLHFDNFTHWATVVRSMLHTDRFPTFKDTVVTFSTYPLGTSACIYYFCRLVGSGEDMQMLGQAYMMVCAILPVFAFARKNSWLSAVLVTVMTGFLFDHNIPLTELLVDTVMPLAAAAVLVFVYHGCISREGEGLSAYYAFPMLLWLMNIKHAALLYVVIGVLVLFFGTGARERGKKECLILAAALVVARRVWSLHSSYVFPEETSGMHSMSSDWFRYILGEKTAEDIWGIARGFASYVVSGRSYFWIFLWLGLLAVLVGLLVKERRRYLALLSGGLAVYAVYLVGLLGMYIFSMPVEEGLASIERYLKSIDVVVYYVFTIASVLVLSQLTDWKKALAVVLAMAAVMVLNWHLQTADYTDLVHLRYTPQERQKIEEPLAEYGVAPGHSYLLCVTPTERSKNIKCLLSYYLLSADAEQIVVTEDKQLEIEGNYDYVIILDQENPVIRQWQLENYPDSVGRSVIQHFN